MAKDDFHVIAYRILAYLYDCMKKGIAPTNEVVAAEVLGIPPAYWRDVLRILSNEGLISGVHFSVNGDVPFGLRNTYITRAGIEYMQFLRTLKDGESRRIEGG